MSNMDGDLIEYSGTSKYIPKNIECFKEFNIDSMIDIELNDRKIKEILRVNTSSEIKEFRVIKTPVGKSLEGENLTGKKCIIEGEIIIRIDYIEDDPNNKMYCKNYRENFSVGITLSKSLLNVNLLIPSIFIEEIEGELLEDNEILVITNMLAVIEK